MSDGQATADKELSTSDTAVPSIGEKTHVTEAPAATLVLGDSTRRNNSPVAQTVVAPDVDDRDTGSVQAQTLIAPAGGASPNGNDYTYGATLVANGGLPGDDANGFLMGATVVPIDDPVVRATQVAEPLNSFDAAQSVGEFEIAPGESLIGRFRVIKTLGEGSFGAVYLAEDPQLDRRVAIKVTKVGVLTTRSDVDRFQREAKAAAQLRHPNIVPVYEVGRIGRSSFLAYEFIDGRTLGSHLKEQKKLAPRDAAQIMFAISGALGYAHELGIIHRDMKPDNVLLDKQEQPHIADFGLARRDSGEMDKTREGGLMGTPLYMSPEQASGRSHEADARADVWSLGVMLREMLTGVLPFTGKLTEILIGIQTIEPPKIRSFDKKLPKDLETICQKCLSKDPALRYANGTELAAELDRYLRGEPILARPLGMPARMVRWIRRNPKEASLVTAVFAVLLGAALVSTWLIIALKQGQREKAVTQLHSLTTSNAGSVPNVVLILQSDRELVSAELRTLLDSNDLLPQARNRLLLAFATLYPESAATQVAFEEIAKTLVTLPPEEVVVQVELLKPFHEHVVPPLRQIADDREDPALRRMAQYALASLDPESPSWNTEAADVAAGLLDSTELSSILKLVSPIIDRLTPELQKQFDDASASPQAATVLAEIFRKQSDDLYGLARRATAPQLRPLIRQLQSHTEHVERLARLDLNASNVATDASGRRVRENAFIVLYSVAPDSLDWGILAGSNDNTLRTDVIESLPAVVDDWRPAATRIKVESDPSVQQALLLVLTKYSVTHLEPQDRAALLPSIVELYRSHPAPGVHAAARLLIEQSGATDVLAETAAESVGTAERGNRDWIRNSRGQEFAVVNGPVEFLMGAPTVDVEQDQNGVERQHLRLIPRSYAVGMREVTVAEYLQFQPEHLYDPGVSPGPDCPMTNLSWIDAAKYCRWLSEQEGIPEEEMCFPPDDQITADMQLPADVLERTGYRLPTAAEWEFACRAGTQTSRWIGDRNQTGLCAWFRDNSEDRTHPVGLLAPNCLGLSDTLGNVLEYCQDFYFENHPVAEVGQPVIDGTDARPGYIRELRGGSFGSAPASVRASTREAMDYADTQHGEAGFRLARTIRDQPRAATAAK